MQVTVEFCASNYMVFVSGELLTDTLTHSEAVTLANSIDAQLAL